ncbi:hypothetical protein ScPMuIL_011755 [Solemya velum]
MCRWGCYTTNTTYMCKWCGTRYCKECFRGDYQGLMTDPNKCRICNQNRCQGQRVEFVANAKPDDESAAKRPGTRGRSAKTTKPSPPKSSKKTKSPSKKKSSGKKKKKRK